MAAVFAGLTILQCAQLAEALAGGAVSIERLVSDLKAKGHKESDPVPHEQLQIVAQAVRPVWTPIWTPLAAHQQETHPA